MVTDVKFRLSIEGVDPVVSGFDRIRGKTGQVTAEMNGTTRSFTSYGMAAIVAEQQTRKLGDAQDALSQRAAKSSKELSFALRGLPAQLTDIFTSLQAGQNPLTVLLQQGGQLKDMFGGIGPAAKAMGGYILGLINPFTIAAGVALTLALAYHQGAQESKAYERAIILSGNAAGTTTQQLQLMAIGISAVSGTQGAAASALASMAQSGQVAGKNLEYFSSVALKMEKSVGQPVADTVKQFADLARAPVDASVKLNEQIHYLTASVYEQIKALEESGRTQEAGELAQSAYAKAMDARTKKLTDNMGSIERGWKSVAGAAKWAWDSMLGIGREQDVATRMQGLTDWYEYFFEPFDRLREIVITELPPYGSAYITVSITGGTVECGSLILGTLYELGDAEFGASAGIIDYSRKETSATGVTTFQRRKYSKRTSLRLQLPKANFNKVHRLLASLRATPCVWIGADDPDYGPLTMLGFYRDFSLDVAYPTVSYCNLEIEGLT